MVFFLTYDILLVRSPARRPPSLCQRAPPPFLLDSSLHSTHLCTQSSLHFTPHTCTPTHHFTPHTCTPTHHFTPHTCLPSHNSQLFPMCGLFMHLSPVPLPAEITCTCTFMCVYVCLLCFLFTDYIRFVRLGHQHYVAVWGIPFLIIVLFLSVGF